MARFNIACACVKTQLSKGSGYERSLFERLQGLGHPYQILRIQYRMHPDISRFPNEEFYNGIVENASNVQSPSYNDVSCQDLYGAYAFLNVADGRERMSGKSFENPIECDVVQHLLNKLQAGELALVG